MKKYKIYLLLAVCAILLFLPEITYAANQVINADEMEAFQKTKQDIQEKWNEGKLEIPSDGIYEVEQSLEAPYNGGVVKQEYLEEVKDNLNYYRYLIGSPEITETPKNREDLQAATVLQRLSLNSGNGLSHSLYNTFPKPTDMTDEFYNMAAWADHNIISSYNYSAPVYPFFSESYFDYTSGHRTSLLSPTTYNVEWGLGRTVYGDVFSSGSNYDLMPSAIAAYPSPGYFPKQDFSSGSDWDIYLNANQFEALSSAEKENVVVTIKSVEKNETYTYTVADGNLYIGNYIIHMEQPQKDTYYNGDYEVYVTNLKNADGDLVDLKYTVKFFDKFEGIESTISDVTYGNDLTSIEIDEEFCESLVRTLLPNEITLKLETGSVINSKVLRYDIKEPGTGYPFYLKRYTCIPMIENLPTWAKDTNNLISDGIGAIVWSGENYCSYKYTQDKFQVEEGENLSISMTYSGINEQYANFEWYKVKNNVVEKLENGTKYQINGTNLTITNFNENDEASYYVVNMEDVPYLVNKTIYVSKGMEASVKPDYIKGDINGDGYVNMFDVNYGYLKLERKDITAEETERGDVTGDGVYNIFDINKVLIYLERKIDEL